MVGTLGEIEENIQGRDHLTKGFISRLQSINKTQDGLITNFPSLSTLSLSNGKGIEQELYGMVKLNFEQNEAWIDHTRAEHISGALRRWDVTVGSNDESVFFIYKRPIPFLVRTIEYNTINGTVMLLDTDDQAHRMGVRFSSTITELITEKQSVLMLQIDDGIVLSTMKPSLSLVNSHSVPLMTSRKCNQANWRQDVHFRLWLPTCAAAMSIGVGIILILAITIFPENVLSGQWSWVQVVAIKFVLLVGGIPTLFLGLSLLRREEKRGQEDFVVRLLGFGFAAMCGLVGVLIILATTTSVWSTQSVIVASILSIAFLIVATIMWRVFPILTQTGFAKFGRQEKSNSTKAKGKAGLVDHMFLNELAPGTSGALFMPEELDIYVDRRNLDAFIFHGKRIDYIGIIRLRYHVGEHWVIVETSTGNFDLGVRIVPELRPYWELVDEVAIVRTESGDAQEKVVVPMVREED